MTKQFIQLFFAQMTLKIINIKVLCFVSLQLMLYILKCVYCIRGSMCHFLPLGAIQKLLKQDLVPLLPPNQPWYFCTLRCLLISCYDRKPTIHQPHSFITVFELPLHLIFTSKTFCTYEMLLFNDTTEYVVRFKHVYDNLLNSQMSS